LYRLRLKVQVETRQKLSSKSREMDDKVECLAASFSFWFSHTYFLNVMSTGVGSDGS